MQRMNNVLFSTGGISRFPEHKDYHGIAHSLRNMSWSCFELLVYDWEDLERAAEELLSTGKIFATIHADKRLGSGFGSPDPEIYGQVEKRFRENVDFARMLGASLMTIHLWGLPDSDDHLDVNIQRLQHLLEYAAERGVGISVETMPGRCRKPGENLARVMDALDGKAGITFDMGILGWQKNLDAMEEPFLIGNGRNVHICDYDGVTFDSNNRRRCLRLGDGTLDIRGSIQRLAQSGYAGYYTVESSYINDAGQSDFERIEKDLGFVLASLPAIEVEEGKHGTQQS